MDPSLIDDEPCLFGPVQTVADRADATPEEIAGWLSDRDPELFDGKSFELEVYFQILDEEDDEAAMDAIGGLSAYASRVAPFLNRLEDDFRAWREDQPALTKVEPGRRSRVSPLAERLSERLVERLAEHATVLA